MRNNSKKKTIWGFLVLPACQAAIFEVCVCVCVFAGRRGHVYVTAWIHVSTTSVSVCLCVWSVNLNLCEGEPGVLLTWGLSDWCVKARVCVCVCVCVWAVCTASTPLFTLCLSSVGFSIDWLDLHCWIQQVIAHAEIKPEQNKLKKLKFPSKHFFLVSFPWVSLACCLKSSIKIACCLLQTVCCNQLVCMVTYLCFYPKTSKPFKPSSLQMYSFLCRHESVCVCVCVCVHVCVCRGVRACGLFCFSQQAGVEVSDLCWYVSTTLSTQVFVLQSSTHRHTNTHTHAYDMRTPSVITFLCMRLMVLWEWLSSAELRHEKNKLCVLPKFLDLRAVNSSNKWLTNDLAP